MSISGLERRLADMEKRINVAPIKLSMPDGSTFVIPCAHRNYSFRLFKEALMLLQGKAPLTPELEAVRDCVESFEPGGSHMIELVHIFLAEREEKVHESVFESE